MELISFMTMAAIGFVVAIVTKIAGFVKEKYGNELGKNATQAIVFFFAIIIALFVWGWQFVPVQIAETIIGIMASAIAWYELVISRFEKKDVGG